MKQKKSWKKTEKILLKLNKLLELSADF